ncbi:MULTISPECIES: bifunctional riboflavin kinase/FAD synthetase [Flavobacterium]|uniref:Riboflavin biosynthesis protein n=2 Tax=Flavobacterium TaxID=237 RepID=A0A2N9P8E5_9FLAO|nr:MULTISPECIES: bifunctional riboflavin kinase/FAD synthetase [Flavobacterium]QYS89900.1 bifunctional riboflavin kinase/FAD synthetase [Flavobacterium davisii]RVU91228.1 bifunctional riboflavin kinase/FAD synthetase [Flavobacterium columnare]SPE76609.1 Riboflavin biosynthesis protein RibF [Flavobacterium columnare]
MKVISDLSNVQFHKKTIVTIGTFDGVHLGHQKIIRKLQSNANQSNETVVITFSNHPRTFLKTDSPVQLLSTNKEKIELLEKLQVDNLLFLEFNQALSALSGEEFVKTILVDKLNIQKIIIGYDHKFGKNRSSDIHDLIRFGEKYNFEVEQISAEELNEITISSTKIRQCIKEGSIALANQYLGNPYTFRGQVIKGNQIGRTIGFPTANIQVDSPLKLIPKEGVYVVEVFLKKQIYKGMMNIGSRPTINGQYVTIEVHLLDCHFEFYGENVTVILHHYLRKEQKFDSLESLKKQLEEDKRQTFLIKN